MVLGRSAPDSSCTNTKNSTMHSRFSTTATPTCRSGTAASTRDRAARVYTSVNVNAASVTFTSRMANTRAITRGVSWPAASCTTISTDDSTNTRNVSIEPASAPSAARAPSG